ncbi:Vacuolar H+-ATPase V1 sector, subunit H [Pseudoloma neurophilia]|uniref:Vacuolar H+-ATPase V1 sector, subunit H n=1 Tax=Pseudoloma neurophilia TaxID=146866 RepID=A0A0R0M075_9MICR|nr:Vacuolar H+-ATPase V1 sector, subunit H [Pseudoloma neurophilia]
MSMIPKSNTLLSEENLTDLGSYLKRISSTNNREKTNKVLRSLRRLFTESIEQYENDQNDFEADEVIYEKLQTSNSISYLDDSHYQIEISNSKNYDHKNSENKNLGNKNLDDVMAHCFSELNNLNESELNVFNQPEPESNKLNEPESNFNESESNFNESELFVTKVPEIEEIFSNTDSQMSYSPVNTNQNQKNSIKKNDMILTNYQIVSLNRLNVITDTTIFNILKDHLSFCYSQYNILIILWQISFTKATHIYFSDLIEPIINIIKRERDSISKLRVCYFIFINLLSSPDSDFGTPDSDIFLRELKNKEEGKNRTLFISVVKCSELLKEINRLDELRGYTQNYKKENKKDCKITKKNVDDDKEFIHSLILLRTLLESRIRTTSSLDNYLKELFSGRLEKSPYHFSESFFLTNIVQIDKLRLSIIRVLTKYIKYGNVTDKLIAVNDLKHILISLPNCINIMNEMGVKRELLKLIECKDTELRVGVLKCLSLLIQENVLLSS